MTDKIEHDIKEIMVDDLFVEVPPEEIESDAGLQSTYGIDSLGFTELRIRCDERFGIEIPDEAFNPEHFATVEDLADLVRDLQNGKKVATSPPEGGA